METKLSNSQEMDESIETENCTTVCNQISNL